MVELSKQSLVRRVAATLDGVGWQKAKAIDQHFGTVAELVMADERELRAIEGIGKELSNKIVKQLRG
jgi:ERCC4-type nuclease